MEAASAVEIGATASGEPSKALLKAKHQLARLL